MPCCAPGHCQARLPGMRTLRMLIPFTLAAGLLAAAPPLLAAGVTQIGYYSPVTQSFGWPTVRQWPAQTAIAPVYYAWGEPYQAGFARLAARHGAAQFAELGTWQCSCGTVTLADVADGSQDGYLRGFARAVKASGHKAYLTFDHEMNGRGWYPWQVPPAQAGQYVAAWRHVYRVVHGADPEIRFVWAPNEQQYQQPAMDYWPGRAYVNAAGVDCYPSAGSSYAAWCAPTVAAIRALWPGPVWVSETGEPPARDRPWVIATFLQSCRTDGIAVVVYFDKDQFALHQAGKTAVAENG